MNGKLGMAGFLLLPVVLIFALLMFVIVDEEERAMACNTGPGTTAAYVDPTSVPKGPVAGYGGEQLVNAATIMAVARKRGMSLRDQQIGVMAAMGESSLTNPNHGDVARNDTIGLFQIGPEHGSHQDRMTPAWAAGNFYDRLVAVPGYQLLEPTIAAHRAQRNADPHHYRKYWAGASEIVAALGRVQSAPAVVPATGGGPASYRLGPVTAQLSNLVSVLGPMFKIKTVGGYRASAADPNGHPAGLSADFMVAMSPAGKTQGDALAAYAQANAAALKVDYVIWRQRIWSASRAAEGWRPMEDRGSPTQNHVDHVHINVLSAGQDVPVGSTVGVGSTCALNVAAGTGGWFAPVGAEAPVTSGFGTRTHPVSGRISFHSGIDYGVACETPIRAAKSGLVTRAGSADVYGHLISIDHGGGVMTEYGHMYSAGVLARVGQQVQAGDVIGKVGSDGTSTGCHLHFNVKTSEGYVDPATFLSNPPAA